MRKLKVGVVSTLIVACGAVALPGCSFLFSGDASTESTDEAGKVLNTYGTPWINSITYGMVKDDTAHDEKNDFYLGVNYDYLKSTSLPDGKEAVGVSYDTSDNTQNRLTALIRDEGLSGHDGELIKSLYGLYTDWDNRDKSGIDFTDATVKKILAIDDIESLSEYLASEDCKRTGVNLVSFDIDYDYEDPDYYSFVVIPTTLCLGDAAEYDARTSYGDMMYTSTEKMVTYTLERMGLSEDDSKSILAGCVDFESVIASSMKTREFKNSNEYAASIKNKMTSSELAANSGSFPLEGIMNTYGLSESDRNYLLEPEWLSGLNDNYNEENLTKIKDYLIVATVRKFMGLSDKESFSKMLESYGVAGNDGEVTESYADNFVKNMLTTPLSKLYCERYTNDAMRSDIRSMCTDIISAYKEILADSNTLSDAAKEKALRKLDALDVNAVSPDMWEDYSALVVRSVADGGSLIDASMDIETFMWNKKLEKMGKTVDKGLWDVDVTQSDVSYWPTNNSVNVFAGITDSDYYRTDMSREEKYAGLGVLIAHEINHAVDDEGGLYDEKGISSSWWSSEDIDSYNAVKTRLADYYSSFKPFKNDTAYNGSRVVSEACAEIAGMQAVLNLAGKEDFDYRKFFESYALANREIIKENNMETAGLNYTKPLSFLKVNATLKQFGKFIDTIGIGEEDTMYTAEGDRIIIW